MPLRALPEPDVNLSIHPAPIVQPVTPLTNVQTSRAVELVCDETRPKLVFSADCGDETNPACEKENLRPVYP